MGRRNLVGAMVGAAVGLSFVFTAWLSPRWGPAIYAVAFGLLAAGLFVYFYIRHPPSLERFRRLSACAFVAVGGVCLGPLVVLARSATDLGPVTRLWMLLGGMIVIFIGMAVFVVWHHLAVARYTRPSPGHPDFAEDAEGNPVRHDESGPAKRDDE